MTEKLYQTNQYLKECTAAVTAVDGNIVTLDRTIFAPGPGRGFGCCTAPRRKGRSSTNWRSR